MVDVAKVGGGRPGGERDPRKGDEEKCEWAGSNCDRLAPFSSKCRDEKMTLNASLPKLHYPPEG
jgi:hypothetical protein